jgi:isopenicillin-N N-acyltransferase-like protein
VDCYLRLIEYQTGRAAEDSLRASAAYAPILESHNPELLLEMQGIADGAGCSLESILLINARSELMDSTDECTALAAGPEVTDNGQVLLAQN